MTLTPVDTIEHRSDFISTDPMGNVYLIDGSSITKYNSNGDSLTSQNFNSLRTIEFFDASQALKLYALNFSFNTLVILDNTLSEQNRPVSFDQIPVEQVGMLCASNFNNTIWIYDAIKMQLVKTDQQFRIQNASVNFYSNENLSGIPNYMVEENNLLYMNFPEENGGIKVFDQYCNFIKRIPVTTSQKFIVRKNKIFYLENNIIRYYNMDDFAFGGIPTLIEKVDDFSIEKNKVYLKSGKTVFILKAEIDL